MDGITIAILCIAATFFILRFILACADEDETFPFAWGAVVALILWKPVFALSLIVIILSGIGLIIEIVRHAD